MGLFRRLLGRNEPEGPGQDATPGQLLDYLQARREQAERVLLSRYRVCPKCESDYLRVGAWATKGRAGWTVTCVNCGLMLDKTVEIDLNR
ncbi:MAG: hypothetical protein Kow0077_31380 [Anaerolineae bacterium]